MNLYRVTTVAKEYHGCRDVTFYWFRSGDDRSPRPYAEVVKDYDPDCERNAFYVQDYVDELFDADEAKALKAYLDEAHGDDSTHAIEQIETPVPMERNGYGCLAVGGGDDFYTLCKEEGYPLPFEVWGYFNLHGCEVVDGSVAYGGYIFAVRAGTIEPVHYNTNLDEIPDPL